MATSPSRNPTNKDALTAKVTADNGGSFDALLQPANQAAFAANPTDLATALTAIIALRNAMVAAGLMKAS